MIHRTSAHVHVVEVGISNSQKFREKSEQHSPLLEQLKIAGYADVQLHLLIFGSTGGMFRLTALHLVRLGIAHPNPRGLDTNCYKAILIVAIVPSSIPQCGRTFFGSKVGDFSLLAI